MVDPGYRDVIYDRKKIRENVVHFTYIEARRLKENIYDALAKELYEKGCFRGAHYLSCLANKETAMWEQKVIRDRVCDNNELLMAVFENVLTSEYVLITKSENHRAISCKALYQILLLLEPFAKKFDWLLRDVFDIVNGLAEDIEKLDIPSSMEYLARIFFKYAMFFVQKGEDLQKAMNYIQKTLIISRNEAWKSDMITEEEWGVYPTLHLVSGRRLAALYLSHARTISNMDPGTAAEYATKAILTLSEVGKSKNEILYFRACLARAEFLLQDENYSTALKTLEKIRTDFNPKTNKEYEKNYTEVHLLEGMCQMNLHEEEGAAIHFRKALKLSQKYKLRRLEAEVLVTMAKMYSRNHFQNRHAQMTFNMARNIYIELNDAKGRKKVHYLLAKLKAFEMFPYFMDMLKNCSHQYCLFYRLRQWKDHCRPFWWHLRTDSNKQDKDKIFCLLERDQNPYSQGEVLRLSV